MQKIELKAYEIDFFLLYSALMTRYPQDVHHLIIITDDPLDFLLIYYRMECR